MGKVKRTRWSIEEKKTARMLFENNLSSGELPSLADCTEAVSTFSELKNRTPVQLKTWLHNQTRERPNSY